MITEPYELIHGLQMRRNKNEEAAVIFLAAYCRMICEAIGDDVPQWATFWTLGKWEGQYLEIFNRSLGERVNRVLSSIY